MSYCTDGEGYFKQAASSSSSSLLNICNAPSGTPYVNNGSRCSSLSPGAMSVERTDPVEGRGGKEGEGGGNTWDGRLA